MIDGTDPPGTDFDDEVGKLQAAIDGAYPRPRLTYVSPRTGDLALISRTIRALPDQRPPVPLDAVSPGTRSFGSSKKDSGHWTAQ
jgi:hypothetical protein